MDLIKILKNPPAAIFYSHWQLIILKMFSDKGGGWLKA